MKRYDSTSRSFASVILACVVSSWVACQTTETAHNSSPEPAHLTRSQAESLPTSGPIRNLAEDETAGGHTLRKHVGRTDDELRERLRREPHIAAASTWTDRATAEQAVGLALNENHAKVQRWLDRAGGHPNLVVDYDGDATHPIGRSLQRGADQPEPCGHAVIVLKWAGDQSYYVLTSYPERR